MVYTKKECPYYVFTNPWIAFFKQQGDNCWICFCLMVWHQNNIVALQWHTLVLFWIRTFGTMDNKNEYLRTSTVTTSCLVLQVVTELTKCIRINGFQIMMCTTCQHTYFSQTWILGHVKIRKQYSQFCITNFNRYL